MYFAKALVAPAVSAILLVLETFGVTGDMTLEQALTVAFSGILVGALTYIVPNKK